MKPTMHLRYRVSWDYHGGEVLTPSKVLTLEQFWEIADDESDLAIPKEIGPDGIKGRWRDVPES